MKFFKEIEQEFNLLSNEALERLVENARGNARNGSSGGKLTTALKKSGASKQELVEKVNPKKIDPKRVLMKHIQEVWIEQRGRCDYSGLPMNEEFLFTGDQNIEAISVERIRNNEGYVVGNIRLVLRGLNKMRSVSEQTQFIDFLKRVGTSVVEKYNL